jgi:hypothetical protein
MLIGDVDATHSPSAGIKIKKLRSFANFPNEADKSSTLELSSYRELIQQLNAIKNADSSLKGAKDIQDFTTQGQLKAKIMLYESASFLGIKEKAIAGKEVCFIDFSWPNIRRIAKKTLNTKAEDILADTFDQTRYAAQGPEGMHLALKEINENLEKLKNVLQQIDEIEKKFNDNERSRMRLEEKQIAYLIDLCTGENGIFDVSGLDDEFKQHFRDRLKEIIANYSGFQRICSTVVMSLLNSIMPRGVKRAKIKKYSKNEYDSQTKELYFTEDALRGKFLNNYYEFNQSNKGDSNFAVYHEITHFYHDMTYGHDDFMPMVTHTILNSGLSLQDSFFSRLVEQQNEFNSQKNWGRFE